MKFIHLGDLHLGKSLLEFDLYEDQKYIIQQILSLAKSEEVDALIIAGDIYDRANPNDAAMNLLDDMLTEAASMGVKTYLVSGNHDSDDKLNFGSSFFAKNNVFIYSVFDGSLHRETISDDAGVINIYMLPFVKSSQVRHFYPDDEIDTYEDAVRVVIEHADIDPEQRNILIAHQFVAGRGGNESPVFGGSEGASVKNVGTVERIGCDIFDAFQYVALGHIHSPQRVGREEVRYAGSPLKYSLSEVNDTKSVPIVNIDEKGSVQIELKELKPLRDMRHIKGKKDQLLLKGNMVDVDDFIYVTLTDEEIVDDAIGVFRQYYPNTIKIDYDNSHTHEVDAPNVDVFAREKSFIELVSDFYYEMYGTEISEEEKKL